MQKKICGICGNEYQNLKTHVKSHGIDWLNYCYAYDMDEAIRIETIKFFYKFYVSRTDRYLSYAGNKLYTVDINTQENRYRMDDYALKRHLIGNGAIGVVPGENQSKFIGFDIDLPDINLMTKVYETIIALQIPKSTVMCSFSGGKGHHVDIFIKELDWVTVKKLQTLILTIVNPPIPENKRKPPIETRGANLSGYKLPFGIHYRTGNYCYACNERGIELDTLEVIKSREKASQHDIYNAIKLAEAIVRQSRPVVAEHEIISSVNADKTIKKNHSKKEIKKKNAIEQRKTKEESRQNAIKENVIEKQMKKEKAISYKNQLENSDMNRQERVIALLERGLHQEDEGNRNNQIFEIALYYKDVEELCLTQAITEIKGFISEKCSVFTDQEEFERESIATVNGVYEHAYKFFASKFEICEDEMQKILSLKTNNKLQTTALRKLLFILLSHSKAYSKSSGMFYMTYGQMASAGAINRWGVLKKQLNELKKLGWLEIYEAKWSSTTNIKSPNNFVLKGFEGLGVKGNQKRFQVCKNGEKCNTCFQKSMCILLSHRKRREYLTDTEAKKIGICQNIA